MNIATDRGRHVGLSRWQASLLLIAVAGSLGLGACDKKSPTEPENQSPTASFISSCIDLVCSLNGSASGDPDGSIAGYAWQFGDGNTGTGASPSHTYTGPGTYEVRLTVTDNEGASSSTAQVIAVTASVNQAPTASFTAACTNLHCSFDGSASSDTDGSVVSHAWDFGDSGAGAGQSVSHTYAGAGTFTVMLTVTDDHGSTGTATMSVTASVAANSVNQLGLTIPGLTNNEQMGRSVAMSDDGSRIIVGAPHSSAGGALSGQVRAFEWNGSAWVQLGQSIDGFETSLLLGDDKGIAMSGDGQRIALGTPRSGPGSWGSVRIYDLVGSTWTQVGQEIVPVATSQFGTAVSLSTNGSRIAIGGPIGGGRAEVYELTGSTWTQLGASIIGTSPERVGYDVSLSGAGTRLMVSAQGATVGSMAGAGKLRVYDWTGSAWTQVGGDIDGREGFGLNASMSRDGRRVVGYAASSGDYAAVFELVGSNWVQMGPDFAIPGAFNVHQNVDLSATGDRVVLGAMFGPPNGHGVVSVYDWNGGSWTQVGMDVVGDHQSAHLGWSVAMSADGSRFVAGQQAYNDNIPISGRGGAKVFTIN